MIINQTSGSGSSSFEIAEMRMFGNQYDNPDYLLCNGGRFDRNKYPLLATALGETYGAAGLKADWYNVRTQLNSTTAVVCSVYDIDGTLFLGDTFNNVVKKSTDGGKTWTTIKSVTVLYDFTVNKDGVLIVIASNEISVSTNKGTSWTELYTGTPASGSNARYSPRPFYKDGAVYQAMLNNSYILMCRYKDNAYEAVYRSSDRTLLFSEMCYFNGKYIAYMGTSGIYTSSTGDSGSWTLVNQTSLGSSSAYNASCMFVDEDNRLYVSCCGYMMYSDNGTSWSAPIKIPSSICKFLVPINGGYVGGFQAGTFPNASVDIYTLNSDYSMNTVLNTGRDFESSNSNYHWCVCQKVNEGNYLISGVYDADNDEHLFGYTSFQKDMYQLPTIATPPYTYIKAK